MKTSSARATPCASVKKAMAKRLSASGFTNARMRVVILFPPSFLVREPCSFALRLLLTSGRGRGTLALDGGVGGGQAALSPLPLSYKDLSVSSAIFGSECGG